MKKVKAKIYITLCTNCKSPTRINPAYSVWHNLKPYCWACRAQLIKDWVEGFSKA